MEPTLESGARSRSACDLRGASPRLDGSRVIRYDGAAWDGVRPEPYKDDASLFAGVTRRMLAAPDAAGFDVRYFEIEPGGHTTCERHRHVHVVVGLRGCGRVRIGDAVEDVGFGDVVYVAPGDPHQFTNPHGEPFGFVCIVDRERDRPVPMDRNESTRP